MKRDPHSGTVPLRRTSVLHSKTLAQGQFTCPEHLQSPKGGATAGRGTKQKGHDFRRDLFVALC